MSRSRFVCFLEALVDDDEPDVSEEEDLGEEEGEEEDGEDESEQDECVLPRIVQGSFELPESPTADDDADDVVVASGPGVPAQSAHVPAVSCIFCGCKSTKKGVGLACLLEFVRCLCAVLVVSLIFPH